MKFYLILLLSLVVSVGQAQIKTPASSPFCKMTQTVGLTDISVEYSRPGVKGRTVFSADGLVPHGNLWRLGANRVTKVSFSDDVTVNGEELAKGDYAVLATPTAASWTFHFYGYESGSWSSYKDAEPTLSVSSKVEKMPMVMETFTVLFGDIKDDSALLEFLWADTYVPLKIGVTVEETVMANIDKVMAGPSANDYYQAATYYHKSGKDLSTALAWIEKATSGEDQKFWQVRRKALILADLGKSAAAIEAAKLSSALAEKAGNAEYVKMNADSIKEWSGK